MINHPTQRCWQCGKGLMTFTATDARAGEVIFEEITLPGGNKVKCHKDCAKTVKATLRESTQIPDPGLDFQLSRKYRE